MTVDITRDVISDLWSLDQAGEASTATKTVIKAFLEHDREFARVLEEGGKMPRITPPIRLSPDAERQLLTATLARARHRTLLIGFGIAGITLITLGLAAGGLYLLTAAG